MRVFSVHHALVLDKQKANEIDYLVDLLTPHGRIRALAKGAQKSRRRFLNLLEDLTYLRVHLRSSQRGFYPILESADPLFISEGARIDLTKYYFFSYVAEILNETAWGPLSTRDFHFLVRFLREIDERQVKPIYKTYFELHWLRMQGLKPHLESCVYCGVQPKRIFYFHVPAGGIICVNCRTEGARTVEREQIDLLIRLGKIDSLEKMAEFHSSSSNLEDLVNLIEDFFFYHLDVESKALPILKEQIRTHG